MPSPSPTTILTLTASGVGREDLIAVLEEALHRVRDLHWEEGGIETDGGKGMFEISPHAAAKQK